MFRNLSLVFTMAALAGMLVSCAETKDEGINGYPYTVVATVGMVGDIVKNVAGGKAEVTDIIGTGVDPHLYKATRGDVVKLSKANVVFYSGLMLEGKLIDALVQVARNKPVFAVTELLDKEYLLEPKELTGHYDPHVWMDVNGWIKAVDVVEQSLSEVDPDNANEYKANADAYREQLNALNTYINDAMASIPEQSRVLVTAHDAFNYFGRAYGLEVMGIQGISTESEAGLEDIGRLVRLLSERKVQAVFVETSVSDKNVRALVEGCAAHGHQVTIGGSLFSDAMGPMGTYEGTYIGMLDHNATTIALALGGNVPEKGLNGKLKASDS